MTGPDAFLVRGPPAEEYAWIERYLTEPWGSTTIVSRGVVHDASRLPALVAVQGAIRFCQRRGMRLVAVHRGAVDDARRLKPNISLIGEHGIPIHDEIEFELELG